MWARAGIQVTPGGEELSTLIGLVITCACTKTWFMFFAPQSRVRYRAEKNRIRHVSRQQFLALYYTYIIRFSVPSTAVSCPPISAPEHGQMMSQSGEEIKFHYGLVKTFSCNNGFHLESEFSQSRRCQATGQWTGKNATCLRE